MLLPAWDQGLREGVRRPEIRDYFRFGLYTGMRRGEVLALRWEQVALDQGRFVVDETKTGEPLALPVTRQLGALLARRFEARPKEARWVFASPDHPERPLSRPDSYYRAIVRHGGKPFWYHALRNCFVAVAAHELKLPMSLVKRLVNHRARAEVTGDYATQWTLEQLRDPAQRIADRIDALIEPGGEALEVACSGPKDSPDNAMSVESLAANAAATGCAANGVG